VELKRLKIKIEPSPLLFLALKPNLKPKKNNSREMMLLIPRKLLLEFTLSPLPQEIRKNSEPRDTHSLARLNGSERKFPNQLESTITYSAILWTPALYKIGSRSQKAKSTKVNQFTEKSVLQAHG